MNLKRTFSIFILLFTSISIFSLINVRGCPSTLDSFTTINPGETILFYVGTDPAHNYTIEPIIEDPGGKSLTISWRVMTGPPFYSVNQSVDIFSGLDDEWSDWEDSNYSKAMAEEVNITEGCHSCSSTDTEGGILIISNYYGTTATTIGYATTVAKNFSFISGFNLSLVCLFLSIGIILVIYKLKWQKRRDK